MLPLNSPESLMPMRKGIEASFPDAETGGLALASTYIMFISMMMEKYASKYCTKLWQIHKTHSVWFVFKGGQEFLELELE